MSWRPVLQDISFSYIHAKEVFAVKAVLRRLQRWLI